MPAITPEQVTEAKKKLIPEEVLEAFNELIAKKFDGQRSVVYQKDVVALIIHKIYTAYPERYKEFESPTSGIRNEIFREGWLDVETIYRAAGWTVEYDKPGFNESYEASFTFSKSKLR